MLSIHAEPVTCTKSSLDCPLRPRDPRLLFLGCPGHRCVCYFRCCLFNEMCGGRRRLIRIDLKLLQTVLLIVLCIDDTRIRLSKPDCYSSVKIRDLHRQLVRLHAENRHLKQRLARKEAETRERKHQQQMKSSDQYKRLQVVLWRLQRNVGELWDFLRHKLKLEDLISYTRGWYQTTGTVLIYLKFLK